jgi:prepilin-type N-terminal cleavage/methylation domain-containing protein
MKRPSQSGFTLIEVVAVLVLIGVLAVSTIVSLLPMAEGFVLAQRNADAARKAQLAMGRISGEFTTITNILSGTANAITYDFLEASGETFLLRRRTLARSGSALLLDGIALSDDVSHFELRYYDDSEPSATPRSSWVGGTSRLIEVILESAASGDRYTNRIAPRNVLFGG